MKRTIWLALFVLTHAALVQAAQQKPGEIEASVVKQIETGTAKQFKLGKVKAKCDRAPDNPKDGDTFACYATTKDNKKLRVTAKISVVAGGKYKVALMATNILEQASINELIKKVLPDIEEQAGEKVTSKNVDCGPYHIFADPADIRIACIVKMPSNGLKKKAEIHYTKTLVTVKVETDKDKIAPEMKHETDEHKDPETKDSLEQKGHDTKPEPEGTKRK